jgi:hypothetical protein
MSHGICADRTAGAALVARELVVGVAALLQPVGEHDHGDGADVGPVGRSTTTMPVELLKKSSPPHGRPDFLMLVPHNVSAFHEHAARVVAYSTSNDLTVRH